jgi:hypothetical protein
MEPFGQLRQFVELMAAMEFVAPGGSAAVATRNYPQRNGP